MYYFFVVNDIVLSNTVIKGIEIVNRLLENKKWIFLATTPYISKLAENDNILIYVAGRNNRYYYASFKIAGKLEENKLVPEMENEKELFCLFTLSCPIKDINVFPEKIPIYDLKEHLSFITDKKNWGLFFRQSVKQINKEDFNLIINKD